MKPLQLLYLLGLGLGTACTSSIQSEAEPDLPNIIILLADDLGYNDLNCYGGVAHTPNLNKLAGGGIRFTDFYAAAPNCSPSRAGLLTGRSPSKVGIYNYLPENHPMHLKAEETTIAEIVKEAGYSTGHFGKWHVGCLPQNPNLNQPQPSDQGFDYSLGTANNARPSHLNPVNFVRNGKEVGEMMGYSCQIIVNEALSWLDSIHPGSSPFLLYMAFHEPHKQVASPPELVRHYSNYDSLNAEYFANVENLDMAIGKLLNGLDTRKLNQNTLVLFASDNGSYRNGSNDPLLGGKSFVYEGGIRVPGIMHWPGKIDAGKIINEPVCLIDVMPTICEITGAAHPQAANLDGTSILPLIRNQPLQRSKPLSWFFYRTTPEIAMRFGDYVMLGKDLDTTRHTHPLSRPDMDHIKNLTIDAFELYHLRNDIGQSVNIDYTTLDQGNHYMNQLVDRLKEIQQIGPYWDRLPPATGKLMLKGEWRQLKPTGFSN